MSGRKSGENKLVDMSVKSAKLQRKSFETLWERSNPDLFEALALKVEEASAGSNAAATFDARFDPDALTRGPMADIGRRIFRRWADTLHSFVCKPSKQGSVYVTKHG